MNDFDKWLTLGRLARDLGVLHGQLRRLAVRNKVPYKLFHGDRVFHVDDVQKIRQVCIEHGYLKTTADAATA